MRRLGWIGIILISIVLFAPFLFKGQIPIPANYMLAWYEPWKSQTASGETPTIAHKPVVDDAFRHLYPLRVLAAALGKQGQLPLWNPYNGAGTPLFAIMHPGYLTPFGIFFLFLRPSIAWGVYIFLQPILLGLATYWYCLRLKLSERSSLFAAIALLLSGFTVVRLEYGEFLYVLSGLPILLGVVEIQRSQTSRRILLAIPGVVAIMMLSGQPHMIVYTLTVFALYALVRLRFVTAVVSGALAVLGVGIAAIQLAPSIELYTLSTIGRQTSTFLFDRFLLPISHLITVVIPNYFGNAATYNYFGPHDYTETIAYIGTIPVFFAFVAAWKNRAHPVVKFFVMLSVLSIGTTLQWLGARVFFRLPIPVLSADVPSRIFVLSTFGIAILAGFGMSEWEKRAPKEGIRLLVIASFLLGTLLFGTWWMYHLQLPCPSPTIPQCRLVSVRDTVIEVMGFVLFVCAAILARRVKGKWREALFWVPCGIVVVLGLYNAYKFLPFSPRAQIFPHPPVIVALQKLSGLDRYVGIGKGSIRTNLTTIYNLFSPEYFDPLHVRRYAELISFTNSGDAHSAVTRSDVLVVNDATPSAAISARRERFLDIASVRYLLRSNDEFAAAGSLWSDTHWSIVERRSALPRAYVVGTYEVQQEGGLLPRLFDPDFDVKNSVVLEEDPHIPTTPLRSTTTIAVYEPTRVQIDVITSQEGLLVLTDTWYPGWRATVDGKNVPLYRANYAFRSVVLPQGSHSVTFTYAPDSVRWGAAISGTALVLWLVGFLVLR